MPEGELRPDLRQLARIAIPSFESAPVLGRGSSPPRRKLRSRLPVPPPHPNGGRALGDRAKDALTPKAPAGVAPDRDPIMAPVFPLGSTEDAIVHGIGAANPGPE